MTDPLFPPGSKFVAYLRASPGVKQDLSVERQEAVIRQWCGEQGCQLTRIFADDNRSGGSTAGREQFDAMIRHFEGGAEEAGIVCWELTRLSRNFDDAQYYISKIRREGYVVHSLSDHIPPGSVGKVVEGLYFWASEEEKRRLGERIAGADHYMTVHFHAYNCGGRKKNNHAPTGYQIEQVKIGDRRDGKPRFIRRLVPDPIEAPLVRQMFQMRAEGRSAREIHYQVHLFKYFNGYTHLLRNPLYIGKLRYKGEIIENFCEPLVDEELFRVVQEVNQKAAARYPHPRAATSFYLLSGLVYCGICGHKMNGHARGTGPRVYLCTLVKSRNECLAKPVRAEKLEELVIERVLDILDKPQLIQDVLAKYQEQAGEKMDEWHAQLLILLKQLMGLEKEKENLVKAIREGKGVARSLVSELEKIEAEEEELWDKRRELEDQKPLPLKMPDFELVKGRLREAIKGGDKREIQLLLQSIVLEVRVVVEKKEIKGEMDYVLGVEGNVGL